MYTQGKSHWWVGKQQITKIMYIPSVSNAMLSHLTFVLIGNLLTISFGINTASKKGRYHVFLISSLDGNEISVPLLLSLWQSFPVL